MAELNTPTGGHKKSRGVQKTKKLSTRVDLTPLVDLGFLLITFFIFTTTMARPKAMGLILPKDVPENIKTLAKDGAVITLLLSKNNQVWYYEGSDPKNMKVTDLKSIRDIILDKKRRTDPILNEMTIDDVHHYALVEISPDEYHLIHAKG